MKYFGTDGIRGEANVFLTDQIAYKVGRYLGYKASHENRKIIIGHDTRISAKMIEASLVSGITSSGCSVDLIGDIPTPGLSYLTHEFKYQYGIMISASHNPYYDNGLKIFNDQGHKIDPFLMQEIEEYLDGNIELPKAKADLIGGYQHKPELLEFYKNYIRIILNVDLSDYNILVDAAHGAGSFTVDLLESLGARVDYRYHKPNGININDQCGSTYIEHLVDDMKDGPYDLGFALDGDADRVMLIDEMGTIVDGDIIMYLAARYFKERKLLTGNTVVCTKMSNLGLLKALENSDIDYVITDVGDSNVFEKMQEDGYIVGGEQSGHVILSHLSIMSDGLISALLVLKIMKEKSLPLSKLITEIHLFPQILVNYKTEQAEAILKHKKIETVCQDIEQELAGQGRIFLRASGTEPLLRIMIEAEHQEKCEDYANRIYKVAQEIDVI